MKWNIQSFRVSINIHVDIVPLLPSVLALLDQSILRMHPSLIPPPPPQSPCVLVPKIWYWWCIKSVQNLARSSDWLTYKSSQRSNIKGSWIFSKEHSFLWKIFTSQGVVLFLLAPTVQLHRMQKLIRTIINEDRNRHSNKLMSGTPWLLDQLSKHKFTSWEQNCFEPNCRCL